MRVGLMAENPLERAIFATGIVPLAMLEGYAPAYSRAILTATRWEFRLAERPTDRPRRRGAGRPRSSSCPNSVPSNTRRWPFRELAASISITGSRRDSGVDRAWCRLPAWQFAAS